MQNGMATLEGNLKVSHKLNIILPYDPTFPHSYVFSRGNWKLKSTNKLKIKPINSTFILYYQKWKQPGYPLVGEIGDIEYYSVINGNELSVQWTTTQQ